MTFVPASADELADGFPAHIDHVSASSITQLLRCPEQFRLTRLQGIRKPPAAAQLWGRADHQAIAQHFAKVIDDGQGLSREDVQDAFAEALDHEIAAEGISEIDWSRAGTDPHKAAAKVKDNGAYLAGLYREQVAPFVHPVEVEARFEVEKPLWPLRIDGYIDVIEDGALIERKTANRRQAKVNPEWVIQARIYQLVKPLPLFWHQSVKHDTMLRQQVEGSNPALASLAVDERTQAMTERLVWQAISTLKHLYLTYGPDEPWPGALSHNWACSYCGLVSDCAWQN